jgi:hypothetical protein
MEGDTIMKQEHKPVALVQLDNEEVIGSRCPDERFETHVEVNDCKGVTLSQVSD